MMGLLGMSREERLEWELAEVKAENAAMAKTVSETVEKIRFHLESALDWPEGERVTHLGALRNIRGIVG